MPLPEKMIDAKTNPRRSRMSCEELGPRTKAGLSTRDFNFSELRRAVGKMYSGKATKDGNVPIAIFNALNPKP